MTRASGPVHSTDPRPACGPLHMRGPLPRFALLQICFPSLAPCFVGQAFLPVPSLPISVTDNRSSHYRPILYHSVLGNDDDAVANEVRTVRTICFDSFAFIHQPDATADARVLVDDRASDDAISPNANAREIIRNVGAHLFQSLIIVSPHHIGAVELCAFGDATTKTEHRTIDLSAVDN